jgi:hypothetical protein
MFALVSLHGKGAAAREALVSYQEFGMDCAKCATAARCNFEALAGSCVFLPYLS